MMRASLTRSDDRRYFLKKTAVAAAAISLPTVLPNRVFGANERINLGIIGMGQRGNQLLKNIPDNGRVVAICDADRRKTAAATAANQTDWQVYQDYRELLDQKECRSPIAFSGC